VLNHERSVLVLGLFHGIHRIQPHHFIPHDAATRRIPITHGHGVVHAAHINFVMTRYAPEFTQPLVLAISVAVVFYYNFTPLFLHSLTMLLHVSGCKQSPVLAITVIVITFSIAADFHTARVGNEPSDHEHCCERTSEQGPSPAHER
jgi:hypothetical protein